MSEEPTINTEGLEAKTRLGQSLERFGKKLHNWSTQETDVTHKEMRRVILFEGVTAAAAGAIFVCNHDYPTGFNTNELLSNVITSDFRETIKNIRPTNFLPNRFNVADTTISTFTEYAEDLIRGNAEAFAQPVTDAQPLGNPYGHYFINSENLANVVEPGKIGTLRESLAAGLNKIADLREEAALKIALIAMAPQLYWKAHSDRVGPDGKIEDDDDKKVIYSSIGRDAANAIIRIGQAL